MLQRFKIENKIKYYYWQYGFKKNDIYFVYIDNVTSRFKTYRYRYNRIIYIV